MKFAMANFLATMFIFIGKIAITVLNVFSCYMIMKYVTEDLDQISSPLVPLAVIGIISYISGSIFLGMFDEVVLALMCSLSIDIDLNGDPKFGPPTFHDSLDGLHDGGKKNAVGEEEANQI